MGAHLSQSAHNFCRPFPEYLVPPRFQLHIALASSAFPPRLRASAVSIFSSAVDADSNRRRVEFGETALMPIGIGERRGTGGVEFCNLCRGQLPADGAQILAQLLLVASPDNNGGDGRSLQ